MKHDDQIFDSCEFAVASAIASSCDARPNGWRGVELDDVASERQNEVMTPEAARSNKVTAVIVRPSSSKVTRRLRRSDSKDRQIIDGLIHSVTAQGPNGELALVGDFHNSILNTSWEHTSDRVKLTFATEALALY